MFKLAVVQRKGNGVWYLNPLISATVIDFCNEPGTGSVQVAVEYVYIVCFKGRKTSLFLAHSIS